jgi:hypothetical protein
LIDPILIDECLSPDLVAVALARGHLALHVVWIDRQGTKDRDLVALTGERHYVFVTNNRRDFSRLYAERPVHNGLLIIVPNVGGATEQCRLFGMLLEAAEQQDSLINVLLEVHADGTVEVRAWAKNQPDTPG